MTRQHLVWAWLLLVSWFALAGIASAAPDGRDIVMENEKDLVVMVEGTVGDSRQEGAGVIVGSDRNSLFIATADHVVREGDQPAGRLSVQFRWRPDQRIAATLLTNHIARSEVSASKIFDLAVLRVMKSAVPSLDLDLLPLELVSEASSLKRGDDVYFIGYPQGKAWYGNVTPAKFADRSGDLLTFETDALLPGYSGGALLDSDLGLAGLIIDTEGSFGTAISFDAIIATVKGWGIPTQLGQRSEGLHFASLGAGYAFSCGLTERGVAYCWSGGAGPGGSNDNDTEETRRLTRLPGGLRFAKLSIGVYHACGVTSAGAGYCIGGNAYGQLGTGSKEKSSPFPEPVAGALKFSAIAAGSSHSCGITDAGRAYCWGENWDNRPVVVQSSETFTAISSGDGFSCALARGRAWCWGDNFSGPLGYFGPITKNMRVPVLVPTDKNLMLVELSSGRSHTCAKSSDGQVVCWGNGDYGQTTGDKFGAVVVPNRKFLSVTAGDESTCAIASDHTAWCWGNADYGALGAGWSRAVDQFGDIEDEIHRQPVAVSGGYKFRALSAGSGSFACGVTDHQELLCWGKRHRRGGDSYGDYGTTPHRVN